MARSTPPPRKKPAKKAGTARKRAAAVKKDGTPRKPTGGRRPGAGRRPTDLHAVVGKRRSGEDVTLIDRVVETLEIGGFHSDAAARVGFRVETLREWLAVGARAQVAIFAGTTRASALTVHERQCVELYERTERAVAEARATMFALVQREVAGGRTRETITEKRIVVEGDDGPGILLQRTTRVEEAAPDTKLLTWWLSHRYPAELGTTIAVTGSDGGPVRVRAESPLEQIAEAIERIRSQADRRDELMAAAALPPAPDTPD